MEEEKKEHEHSEHEHTEHESHHHKKNFTEKFRQNPWILATLIFGVIVLVLLISTVTGGLTGNLSSNAAGQRLLQFYQSVGIQNLSVSDVKDVSGLYQVDLLYNGKTIPVYITKDGKSFTESLTPLSLPSDTSSSSSSSSSSNQQVPKSDKPKVELYVFAYCPYGIQMEKAMIPVVKLFGNQIDFAIRQIGAMHGDFEQVEAQRQLCINKYYPDKYLDYVLAFDSDSSCSTGDATCVATKTTSIYAKLGIDASKINSCMTSEAPAMYNAEEQNAQAQGVSGSPTLIINGVVSNADRSEEGVKGAICSAFNNVPSLCSQTLSTTQESPGFGSGSSSSSSSSQCGN